MGTIMSEVAKTDSPEKKSESYYEVVNSLKKGALGSSSRVRYTKTGEISIWKRIKHETINLDKDNKSQFLNLTHYHNKGIVRYTRCIITARMCHALTEDQGDTSLFAAINNPEIATLISSKFILKFAIQAIDALSYIASCGIVHGRLHPENVFINENMDMKINDFGLASFFPSLLLTFRSSLFTFSFIAPEIIDGCRPTIASDVFSLGSLIFYAHLKKPIFTGINSDAVRESMKNFSKNDITDPSEPLMQLFIDALEENPKKRPTLSQLSERLRTFRFPLEHTLRVPAPSLKKRRATSEAKEEYSKTHTTDSTSSSDCDGGLTENKIDSRPSARKEGAKKEKHEKPEKTSGEITDEKATFKTGAKTGESENRIQQGLRTPANRTPRSPQPTTSSADIANHIPTKTTVETTKTSQIPNADTETQQKHHARTRIPRTENQALPSPSSSNSSHSSSPSPSFPFPTLPSAHEVTVKQDVSLNSLRSVPSKSVLPLSNDEHDECSSQRKDKQRERNQESTKRKVQLTEEKPVSDKTHLLCCMCNTKFFSKKLFDVHFNGCQAKWLRKESSDAPEATKASSSCELKREDKQNKTGKDERARSQIGNKGGTFGECKKENKRNNDQNVDNNPAKPDSDDDVTYELYTNRERFRRRKENLDKGKSDSGDFSQKPKEEDKKESNEENKEQHSSILVDSKKPKVGGDLQIYLSNLSDSKKKEKKERDMDERKEAEQFKGERKTNNETKDEKRIQNSKKSKEKELNSMERDKSGGNASEIDKLREKNRAIFAEISGKGQPNRNPTLDEKIPEKHSSTNTIEKSHANEEESLHKEKKKQKSEQKTQNILESFSVQRKEELKREISFLLEMQQSFDYPSPYAKYMVQLDRMGCINLNRFSLDAFSSFRLGNFAAVFIVTSRHHLDPDDATDSDGKSVDAEEKNKMKKTGNAAMEQGMSYAKLFVGRGYRVGYFADPTTTEYYHWMEWLLQNVQVDFVSVYVGIAVYCVHNSKKPSSSQPGSASADTNTSDHKEMALSFMEEKEKDRWINRMRSERREIGIVSELKGEGMRKQVESIGCRDYIRTRNLRELLMKNKPRPGLRVVLITCSSFVGDIFGLSQIDESVSASAASDDSKDKTTSRPLVQFSGDGHLSSLSERSSSDSNFSRPNIIHIASCRADESRYVSFKPDGGKEDSFTKHFLSLLEIDPLIDWKEMASHIQLLLGNSQHAEITSTNCILEELPVLPLLSKKERELQATEITNDLHMKVLGCPKPSSNKCERSVGSVELVGGIEEEEEEEEKDDDDIFELQAKQFALQDNTDERKRQFIDFALKMSQTVDYDSICAEQERELDKMGCINLDRITPKTFPLLSFRYVCAIFMVPSTKNISDHQADSPSSSSSSSSASTSLLENSYSVGSGLLLAEFFVKRGYRVLYSMHPTATEYLSWVKWLMNAVQTDLVCIYCGTVTNVSGGYTLRSSNTSSGLCFVEESVKDEWLAALKKKYGKCASQISAAVPYGKGIRTKVTGINNNITEGFLHHLVTKNSRNSVAKLTFITSAPSSGDIYNLRQISTKPAIVDQHNCEVLSNKSLKQIPKIIHIGSCNVGEKINLMITKDSSIDSFSLKFVELLDANMELNYKQLLCSLQPLIPPDQHPQLSATADGLLEGRVVCQLSKSQRELQLSDITNKFYLNLMGSPKQTSPEEEENDVYDDFNDIEQLHIRHASFSSPDTSNEQFSRLIKFSFEMKKPVKYFTVLNPFLQRLDSEGFFNLDRITPKTFPSISLRYVCAIFLVVPAAATNDMSKFRDFFNKSSSASNSSSASTTASNSSPQAAPQESEKRVVSPETWFKERMNQALQTARLYQKRGYRVLYFVNPTATEYYHWMEWLLRTVKKELASIFIGEVVAITTNNKEKKKKKALCFMPEEEKDKWKKEAIQAGLDTTTTTTFFGKGMRKPLLGNREDYLPEDVLHKLFKKNPHCAGVRIVLVTLASYAGDVFLLEEGEKFSKDGLSREYENDEMLMIERATNWNAIHISACSSEEGLSMKSFSNEEYFDSFFFSFVSILDKCVDIQWKDILQLLNRPLKDSVHPQITTTNSALLKAPVIRCLGEEEREIQLSDLTSQLCKIVLGSAASDASATSMKMHSSNFSQNSSPSAKPLISTQCFSQSNSQTMIASFPQIEREQQQNQWANLLELQKSPFDYSFTEHSKYLERLDSLGCINLMRICEAQLPKNFRFNRLAVLFLNPDEGQSNSLGIGPLTNGILIAELLKKREFVIFYTCDCSAAEYYRWMEYLIDHSGSEFVQYFSGHGGEISDPTGLSESGKSSFYSFPKKEEQAQLNTTEMTDANKTALSASSSQADIFLPSSLFSDYFPFQSTARGVFSGMVIDWCLFDLILNKASINTRIVLISECCHAGSLFNLDKMVKFRNVRRDKQLPNAIHIGASAADQSAKQLSFGDGTKTGWLSKHMIEILQKEPNMSFSELKQRLDGIQDREQNVQITATKEGLMEQSILPNIEKKG
ncbi:putative Protein kinase domain [Monocercomonoides exilis]|uniref:putative Protein kinase domain n=1 Tax=Monocercomonoides exilis TaxID=2049356 RepID=UPI0035597081|nr:putative Protein kinase domain [Monocercomonoides exilis]|eukprot:MONOS_9428.1-p1 / transcript=MONOS_9428.1 / gene=MONOS_9428 / organism=Monocercomonoides_exilis_PA203 / gene_product=unspecified product / transcript_product=unspecified product / location=Mono_scaffold00389:22707-30796(+) / protein_length=2499 / sequence_SO=supercontig / SO=protein_coding / is_pseudo=false